MYDIHDNLQPPYQFLRILFNCRYIMSKDRLALRGIDDHNSICFKWFFKFIVCRESCAAKADDPGFSDQFQRIASRQLSIFGRLHFVGLHTDFIFINPRDTSAHTGKQICSKLTFSDRSNKLPANNFVTFDNCWGSLCTDILF